MANDTSNKGQPPKDNAPVKFHVTPPSKSPPPPNRQLHRQPQKLKTSEYLSVTKQINSLTLQVMKSRSKPLVLTTLLEQLQELHTRAGTSMPDFAAFLNSPDDSVQNTDANRLLTALAKNNSTMTQTEVSDFFKHNKTKEELHAILDELLTANKIRKYPVQGNRGIIWTLTESIH